MFASIERRLHWQASFGEIHPIKTFNDSRLRSSDIYDDKTTFDFRAMTKKDGRMSDMSGGNNSHMAHLQSGAMSSEILHTSDLLLLNGDIGLCARDGVLSLRKFYEGFSFGNLFIGASFKAASSASKHVSECCNEGSCDGRDNGCQDGRMVSNPCPQTTYPTHKDPVIVQHATSRRLTSVT